MIWYKNNNSDIVVSTRIRLARNVDKTPFPNALKDTKEVTEKIKNAVLGGNSTLAKDFDFIDLDNTPLIRKQELAEEHLISPVMCEGKGKSVMISKDRTMSIMLMEEDHIRLQIIKDGFALDEAYSLASKVDDVIGVVLARGLLVAVSRLGRGGRHACGAVADLLLVELLQRRGLTDDLLGLVLGHAVLRGHGLVVGGADGILGVLLHLLRRDGDALVLGSVEQDLVAHVGQDNVGRRSGVVAVVVLDSIEAVLALDGLTRGDVALLAVVAIACHGRIELVLGQGRRADALAAKTTVADKEADHRSNHDGDHKGGNHRLLVLGCMVVRIGVVLVLLLGHEVLVGGVRGDLCLQASILLLGRRAGGNVLGRRAGDQVDLLVLVTVGAFAALDDLDTVDLVLLVLLLNQTHINYSLLGNIVPNRIRPTERRAY